MRQLLITFVFSFLSGFCLLFSPLSLAQVAEVRSKQANIYLRPSLSSTRVGTILKGRRVQLVGEKSNGFVKLKSKSGRSLWVQADDLSIQDRVEADLVEPSDPRSSSPKPVRSGPLISWDLGFSSGSVGDISYSEATLGINTFFKDWLAWRNSFFYRFVSIEGVDDFYGLDTMGRLYYQLNLVRSVGVTFFGGPGYRFINEGDNVPFAEAGLIMRLGGLSLGGGVKSFFTNWVNEDAEDDTQFFIILSGSGIL